MAKSQKRTNREAKKPKQAKKPAPASASPFAEQPRAKGSAPGGSKK